MGDRTAGAARAILGLSFGFHDAAAALVVDGEIVAAAEEERFTRRKHDSSLPRAAIAACLDRAGLRADDVTDAVFYERPMNVATRYLASRQREGPRSLPTFVRDAPTVFGRNLLAGYHVASTLRDLGAAHPPPLQYADHHASHAAAAFYPSPFEEAAILTVDGIGEWATATIGQGTRHRITTVEELRHPDSLGLVYSLVTAWCGLRANDDEYKVMGLAPYGEPRFAEALRDLARVHPDGSLRVDGRRLRWFSGAAFRDRGLHRRLGGPPRRPDDPLTEREADLAASVQALTEDAMLAMAARAHERTGSPNLCLAGGVALNCVANGRILREGPFEALWIQPAAGDAGSAIGAALTYWHGALGRPREAREGDRMSWAALGPELDPVATQAAIERAGLAHEQADSVDALVGTVADALAAGQVVGWVQGPMEFGPRALGNRSLLADPRNPDVRQRLNRVVKGREDFRPFAPAVLAEHAAAWFELDDPSPYMLLVAPVRAEHLLEVATEPADLDERAAVARSTIPACTHVDGSARIQTVTESSNPRFRRLLAAFEQRTGCPMLVNTSFNRAGEPIVADAGDAIAAARAGGIDLLVLGDHLVRLEGAVR
jgi:carbamoyltransferase